MYVYLNAPDSQESIKGTTAVANVIQQNDNGLNLRNTDAIDYMRWMQKEAAQYGMKIGLKNSLDIVNDLASIMDFAVNEQCAQLGECRTYDRFLGLNKPVFHIEYPNPLNAGAANGISCTSLGVNGTSTILKNLQLDGITYYCDGSYVNTPTLGGTSPPRPSRPPPVPRPSSSRPGPSPRPSSSRPVPQLSTTRRPSPTPVRPSSTQRPPTSTPGGGGGGCRSKHWDQCGGNDWKGCTVCEVSRRYTWLEFVADMKVLSSRRIHARVSRRLGTISVFRLRVWYIACYLFAFSSSCVLVLVLICGALNSQQQTPDIEVYIGAGSNPALIW
jgi:hypothetical protein